MLIILLVVSGIILFLLRKKIREFNSLKSQFEGTTKAYDQLYNRYKDVIDIEKEKEKVIKEREEQKSILDTLKQEYVHKKTIFDSLSSELAILEENMELISYGFYKPHYDFDTSEKYKDQLEKIRDLQKQMIKDKTAAVCRTEWTVSGSKAEGKKMTDKSIKLMLRAFNNECDAAVVKVSWNNVEKMEERIRKAFEAINKMGETNQIDIVDKYLKLKLDELHLAYEYQEKLHEEKEEQRRIREQMREEEKALKEIEQAQKEADAEEKRYQKALDQAKKDIDKAKGKELENLNTKILELESQLKEAQEKKERAIAMAQMTKSGHVYVISNIGSFGEDVFKIGMTRRLEPMDRVKELGDASVPFEFDVHALIYSENAPDLENKLHKAFDRQRLNLVNTRKEFFNVGLSDIEKIVKQNHGEIEFTKLAEAREYRESLNIKNQAIAQPGIPVESKSQFPDVI